MTLEQGCALALEIINATKRGEPLHPIPDGVKESAVRHCIALGEIYRELDKHR